MTTDRTEQLWGWVEGEKRLDARIQRISKIAWTVTVLVVVLYGMTVVARLFATLGHAAAAGASRGEYVGVVIDTLVPLISVVGQLSVLVAVLSTIAIFLRFRTASLAEINARLTAMEQMLAQDPPRG